MSHYHEAEVNLIYMMDKYSKGARQRGIIWPLGESPLERFLVEERARNNPNLRGVADFLERYLDDLEHNGGDMRLASHRCQDTYPSHLPETRESPRWALWVCATITLAIVLWLAYITMPP